MSPLFHPRARSYPPCSPPYGTCDTRKRPRASGQRRRGAAGWRVSPTLVRGASMCEFLSGVRRETHPRPFFFSRLRRVFATSSARKVARRVDLWSTPMFRQRNANPKNIPGIRPGSQSVGFPPSRENYIPAALLVVSLNPMEVNFPLARLLERYPR